MNIMASVKYWPILSFLPTEFAELIKNVIVFGGAGNEALMKMKSGDYYALGFNCNGCLGIGDGCNALEPRKVENLSQKTIVSMAYGSGPHFLAVTDTGELYSWGNGGYGQLGHNEMEKSKPTQVVSNLQGKKVILVGCGSYHSLTLTSDGEVYCFGSNNCGQLGLGSSNNQGIPKKVLGLIGGKKIVSVACGQSFNVVLSADGEVFSWGYNGNGQLGIGNNTNQQVPMKVSIPSAKLVLKIFCGMAHVLALTDVGDLLSWGANSFGQLGIGTTLNTSLPTLVHPESERWADIAAHHYNHISCAANVTGKIYMWGQCHGVSLLLPREVPLSSLDEVFALFGQPQVMFRPLEIGESEESTSVRKSLEKAFDDKETSDLVFLVGEKKIHVHKAILKIRCEHFRIMMQSHWEEDSKSQIEITDFSYDVFKAFLQYLYTDKVDLSPEDAIGLLDLANAYCETDLKQQCEAIIKRGISVTNGAMLYAVSLKYRAKDLENHCFRFLLNHMTAVTNTEAFQHLDGEIVKSFVIKAAEMGAFKH